MSPLARRARRGGYHGSAQHAIVVPGASWGDRRRTKEPMDPARELLRQRGDGGVLLVREGRAARTGSTAATTRRGSCSRTSKCLITSGVVHSTDWLCQSGRVRAASRVDRYGCVMRGIFRIGQVAAMNKSLRMPQERLSRGGWLLWYPLFEDTYPQRRFSCMKAI